MKNFVTSMDPRIKAMTRQRKRHANRDNPNHAGTAIAGQAASVRYRPAPQLDELARDPLATISPVLAALIECESHRNHPSV